MDLRLPPVFVIILLIFLSVIAGCTSSTPPQGTAIPIYDTTPGETVHAGQTEKAIPGITTAPKESIEEQLAAVRSENPVWREAYRMYGNIKSTEYIHPPYTVDDAAGIYKFDCLGFVDHVLMGADIASYKEIGKDVNPSIESYSAWFNRLSDATPNTLGWTKVSHPAELKPGDVCLWLKPTTLDTGHMWIIAGEPTVNPKRTDEVLVRIFDSSVAHSDDSRTVSAFKTGLGSGILGMMVDGKGNPVGLYWDGGVSTSAGERDTTIVCGRLNR